MKQRIRLALHVLRGRPTIYGGAGQDMPRLTISEPIRVISTTGCRIENITLTGGNR